MNRNKTLNFRRFQFRQQHGIVLLAVLVMGMIFIGLLAVVTNFASYQTIDRGRYETYKDEFAAAEEALNKGFAHVQFLVKYGTNNLATDVAAIQPPTVDGFTFPNYTMTETFNGFESVTDGQWEGLNLYRIRYQLDVTAKSSGNTAQRFDHPGVALSQEFEITYIPLFNFAIFYDPVLEIAPGPRMDILGRVHANGDMYIQAGNQLNFHDRITGAGNIYHGRHPDSGKSNSNNPVNIYDGSSFESMAGGSGDTNGDGWLDSLDAEWTQAALDRWDSYVKSVDHGVNPLGLPIPTTYDPHSIIERADPVNDSVSLKNEKFEYKAGMKIIGDNNGNISAVDQNGNPISLTYPDPGNPGETKSIVSVGSFYDAREQMWVSSIDVNLANMQESGIRPGNSILYVTNENQGGTRGVVRLVEGAELPQGVTEGFSVASDDPMYVQGDFNTVNQTLAMIAGDAISVMSNAWDDANSNNWSARVASETTQNAVMIQGIVPSQNSTYSGGVENYFRFMESWSGTEYIYNGSIVSMWESQVATGSWSYGSPVYKAPIRTWAWDSNLGGMNGPPGAPRVVEILKKNWKLGTHIN